eukprot:jgi/Bigna1/74449/fgenesh1_pg.29_\
MPILLRTGDVRSSTDSQSPAGKEIRAVQDKASINTRVPSQLGIAAVNLLRIRTMNRPLITRRDSLLGDLSAGHTGYEYLSEERSIPKEAEDAKKILQDLILQEIKICNRLTEYLEFWQTQMRRSPWLVRLEFMSPWNPDGVEPEELKQNARTCATSLMSRLTRLGGDLHEHNLMAGRIDSKAAGVWSRRAWTLIHRKLSHGG